LREFPNLQSNMNHFPCIMSEKGFTLIEILIAMVILGIAFMGLANLQISCINGNSNSCCLTKAVILAQDKMEELKSLNPDHPDLSDPNPGNNDNLRQSIDSQDSDHREDKIDIKGESSKTIQDLNYDSYTRIWNVANNTPFSGRKTVVVIVTWESGRKSVVISSVI
jgi:prepilin-type N-terminal cleavage/methylation domain-containing protein